MCFRVTLAEILFLVGEGIQKRQERVAAVVAGQDDLLVGPAADLPECADGAEHRDDSEKKRAPQAPLLPLYEIDHHENSEHQNGKYDTRCPVLRALDVRRHISRAVRRETVSSVERRITVQHQIEQDAQDKCERRIEKCEVYPLCKQEDQIRRNRQ